MDASEEVAPSPEATMNASPIVSTFHKPESRSTKSSKAVKRLCRKLITSKGWQVWDMEVKPTISVKRMVTLWCMHARVLSSIFLLLSALIKLELLPPPPSSGFPDFAIRLFAMALGKIE